MLMGQPGEHDGAEVDPQQGHRRLLDRWTKVRVVRGVFKDKDGGHWQVQGFKGRQNDC